MYCLCLLLIFLNPTPWKRLASCCVRLLISWCCSVFRDTLYSGYLPYPRSILHCIRSLGVLIVLARLYFGWFGFYCIEPPLKLYKDETYKNEILLSGFDTGAVRSNYRQSQPHIHCLCAAPIALTQPNNIQ